MLLRVTAISRMAVPQGPNCPRKPPKVVATFSSEIALLEILSAAVATHLLQAQKDTSNKAVSAH